MAFGAVLTICLICYSWHVDDANSVSHNSNHQPQDALLQPPLFVGAFQMDSVGPDRPSEGGILK